MTKKEKAMKALYKACAARITEQTQEIHRLVEGNGSLDSKVVFISHMPNLTEEEEGIAYAGEIGEAFNKVLASVQLKIEDIYVTHLVKYEPYKMTQKRVLKRKPNEAEYQFFYQELVKELDIIKPEYIVSMGQEVLQVLMNDPNISLENNRGKLLTVNFGLKKYKLIPIHHPGDHHQTFGQDIEVIKTIWDYIEGKSRQDADEDSVKYTIPPKTKEMKSKETAAEKEASGRTKVIIVNGCTAFSDDPTVEVLHRVSHVLTELNTNIVHMDLNKAYDIEEFLQELSSADGVILATTVTWLGIGGKLQLFLDACHRYGRQTLFESVYLMGIVISKQMYERDAYHHLIRSWELLGGMEGTSICASIKNVVAFETDKLLARSVDRKAETFYRIIHQKSAPLPSSIRTNKILFEVEHVVETKEEVSSSKTKKSTLISNYDEFIEKQKQDIEDLSSFYKKKGSLEQTRHIHQEPERFLHCYRGSDLTTKIQWHVNDQQNKGFHMVFNQGKLNCNSGITEDCQVNIHLDYDILRKISSGKLTVQRAFMTGLIKVQGDFSVMYQLDTVFDLNQ